MLIDDIFAAVDGVLSDWSEWSDCEEITLCSGMTMRSRDCMGPFHGGAYCNGYTHEVAGCQAC